MRYSGIGGQAVMEGVMMRNGNRVAVAVRLEDGQIVVDEQTIRQTPKWVEKTPLLRGVYAFFHSPNSNPNRHKSIPSGLVSVFMGFS